MMTIAGLRRLCLVAVIAALGACSSTATQTTSVDSRSGAAQTISGTIGFGAAFNPRYVGRWTMSDRFARSCTYQFLGEPMGGSGSIGRAEPTGFCTAPFDDVAGWRATRSQVVLFDASGNRLASLSADGSGLYRGRFRGRTLSSDVILRKGFV